MGTVQQPWEARQLTPGGWGLNRQAALTPAAGAAIGKYIEGTVATNTLPASGGSFILSGEISASTRYRLKSMPYSRAGAVDPTSTVRISMYEATAFTEEPTGFKITLGAEVEDSVMTPVITTRGKISPIQSKAFKLTPGKNYVAILEIATANLPAAVVLQTTLYIYARNLPLT